MAFDPFGNLFASDCHSEPMYQILAGAFYPSFGKPHDGLGFAPKMMEKPRGSTALDGISIYSDDLWPEEFRGNIFIGDVMASRIYRDRVTEEGSTRTARPMRDFLAADDAWFRPVDTTLGPDGAFYVADFYNRIIGHYEVPLTHPGRDRTSGRIWRIVRRDKPLRPVTLPADLKGLIQELASPNLTRRMLAMNAIQDRFAREVSGEIDAAIRAPVNPEQHIHALWIAHRLETSKPDALMEAARARSPLVRVHAQRIAGDIFAQDSLGHVATDVETDPDHITAAMQMTGEGLKDRDALVRRCAAEAGARHLVVGGDYFARQLLALRTAVPASDTHLLYVARQALRDQLRYDGVFEKMLAEKLTAAEVGALADVSLGITNAAAATFLLRQLPELSKEKNPSPPVADILKHAARYAPESELGQLASFAMARIPKAYGAEQYQEIERQFGLFKSVDEGLQQRGRARPEPIRAWGTNLVWKFFTSLDGYHSWSATPYEPNPTDVPWDIETRNCGDGRKRQLMSSLPHGENLTGVIRSSDFSMPSKLSFWLCGHDGFPDKPAGHLNLMRLRLRDSGEVLATAPAPRNDVARRVSWDLPEHTGKRVFVEAIDGDDGRAYAWIAFGAFDPELPELRPAEFSPRKMRDWLAAAADSAVRLQMKDCAPVFAKWLAPRPGANLEEADTEMWASLAHAWMALEPAQAIPIFVSALTTQYGPVPYREAVAGVLAAQNMPDAQAAVLVAAKSLPLKSQEKISLTLATSTFSAETLLAGIENGSISPRVLHRVSVNTRLKSSKPGNWEARLKKLTAKLPAPDDARNRLIAERRAAFSTARGKPDAGKLVFSKYCAACHKIGNEGAIIGPQLDGIGQRGLERLCEDVLDPNRNVDIAFRSALFTLKDGDIVSGLFRREEGESIVLAESTGKEITVAKGNVAERRESEISLMPENFGELIPPADFADLMAYLLSRNASAK
jgi:putative heme-binding domain-containing protein